MSTFIELDYTGRVDGAVFDTTQKADAPLGSKGPFEPAIVKLGLGQLIPGLDKFLTGKGPGKYEVTLQPEDAFGPKNAKLLKLVPLTAFGKEKQKIESGMNVRIGEQQGTVKSISGGRVVVDFNHPLAGKAVTYSLLVHGEVKDPKKKVDSIVRALLGVALPTTVEGEKVIVSLPKGFPAEGFVKELEKQTGVTVGVQEVDLGKHEHVHDENCNHD
jgi:FKBP-type peptidyl-prolyl cis-trans isomerase SlyD